MSGSFLASLRTDVAALVTQRHVIALLVGTTIKARYQRSVLGLLWTLLNPAFSLAILAVVFGHVLGRGIPNYPVYVFAALVPFQAAQELFPVGSQCLLHHESIIKVMRVHKLVFPLAALFSVGVNFLVMEVTLFLVFLALGAPLYPQAVALPAVIFLYFLFLFGLLLVAMTAVTFFRDFENILGVGMRALYFLSPIILLPEHLGPYEPLMRANPLTSYFSLFHDVLYFGRWPSGGAWLLTSGMAAVAVLIGYMTFKRFEGTYVFRL